MSIQRPLFTTSLTDEEKKLHSITLYKPPFWPHPFLSSTSENIIFMEHIIKAEKVWIMRHGMLDVHNKVRFILCDDLILCRV